MKILTLLVGNIGSGKSTWIKNNKKDALVVSKDSLRYMVGGGVYLFNPKIENIIWDIEKAFLNRAMLEGHDIIIDASNMNKKTRKSFIKVAKAFNYYVLAVVMPLLSKEECITRRMTNPHDQPSEEIWGMVWDKFNKQYEEPTLDEGINEIIFLNKEAVSNQGRECKCRYEGCTYVPVKECPIHSSLVI